MHLERDSESLETQQLLTQGVPACTEHCTSERSHSASFHFSARLAATVSVLALASVIILCIARFSSLTGGLKPAGQRELQTGLANLCTDTRVDVPVANVVTYNQYWWCVSDRYGNCGKFANGKGFRELYNRISLNHPFDLIGFQECDDVTQVIRNSGYDQCFDYDHGNDDIPIAWNNQKYRRLSSGYADIGGDNWGIRKIHWVRLAVNVGGTVFFANTHGPLGQCDGLHGKAIADNYLKVINEHMQPFDALIFAGDFNCGVNTDTFKHLRTKLALAADGASYGGADHIFTNGLSVISHAAVNGYPSDHQLIKASIDLKGPAVTGTIRGTPAPQRPLPIGVGVPASLPTAVPSTVIAPTQPAPTLLPVVDPYLQPKSTAVARTVGSSDRSLHQSIHFYIVASVLALLLVVGAVYCYSQRRRKRFASGPETMNSTLYVPSSARGDRGRSEPAIRDNVGIAPPTKADGNAAMAASGPTQLDIGCKQAGSNAAQRADGNTPTAANADGGLVPPGFLVPAAAKENSILACGRGNSSSAADTKLPVGAEAEYYSTTHGHWIRAVVNGFNVDTETYQLDVHPMAQQSRVRPVGAHALLAAPLAELPDSRERSFIGAPRKDVTPIP